MTSILLLCACLCFVIPPGFAPDAAAAEKPAPANAAAPAPATAAAASKPAGVDKTGKEEDFKKVQTAFNNFCDRHAAVAAKAAAKDKTQHTKKEKKSVGKDACCKKLREAVQKGKNGMPKYSGKGKTDQKAGKLVHKHAEGEFLDNIVECKPYKTQLMNIKKKALDGNAPQKGAKTAKKVAKPKEPSADAAKPKVPAA